MLQLVIIIGDTIPFYPDEIRLNHVKSLLMVKSVTSLLFATKAWYRLQSNLLGAPWSFELSEQSPGSDAVLGEDC
jgi:hypothetical protein